MAEIYLQNNCRDPPPYTMRNLQKKDYFSSAVLAKHNVAGDVLVLLIMLISSGSFPATVPATPLISMYFLPWPWSRHVTKVTFFLLIKQYERCKFAYLFIFVFFSSVFHETYLFHIIWREANVH